jgi:hypothetical protein
MSSIFSYRIAALLCLLLLQGSLRAQLESPEGTAALSYREVIVGVDPMGLEGVDQRLSRILRYYYRSSLGGPEGWGQVESFRFEGVLRMPQGALSFVAFKKKPDYCKIVLFGGKGVRIVMSYDGEDAWQLNTAESAQPSLMPPVEALNFIRDAPVAGHLLYPSLPGKQIELIGRRAVNEHVCYDLRVTLPDGQQVTYAIDCTDFVERQLIVVNAVSGETEVTTHERIEQVEGVSVPMQSTMTVDGELVHEVRMRRVELNQGLMPWMFARPSGAYVPGVVPEAVVELDGGWDLADSPALDPEATSPSFESFGLDEPPAGAFEGTRFPDLDAETTQSILDDIGDL